MLMWIMSDRAIPRSFRFMEGFGVHTFRLVNAEGRSTFVKFHWKPKQGLQSVVWNEAVKINGADPDFHRRDLWDAIRRATSPSGSWGSSCSTRRSPTGSRSTCSTPPSSSPRRRCRSGGSAGWCSTGWSTTSSPRPSRSRSAPRTSCPGIDFTNDPLLQGRNFSYLDTQVKRLGGPNFTHIPINAPKCPFANFQQDGHMAMRQPDDAGQLRAQLVGARGSAVRGRIRSRDSPAFPADDSGRQAAAAARELRRPLQPGAAVLPQPDRG